MTDTKLRSVECPIFTDMSLDDRERVLALFEHESFPVGETILHEGLSIQILWIIVSGRCEVRKRVPEGTDQVLAELEQGAIFGEMSFFHPAPHSASVWAVTDVETIRLSRERFEELAKQSPTAAFQIAANTAAIQADRLRKMDDWICRQFERPETNDRQREEWDEFRSKLYTEWDF